MYGKFSVTCVEESGFERCGIIFKKRQAHFPITMREQADFVDADGVGGVARFENPASG